MKTPRFTIDAREVSRTLQGAFAEVLHSVGADPSTPQSIVRHLGLNKNLAWKISRIVQAEEAASVLELMPGSSGIRIFLNAMDKAGIEKQYINKAREAVKSYEELIRIHSGNRATLEMMSSDLDQAGQQQRDEYHRKLLFQGSSYVWGAQARVISKIGVVYPGSKPGLLNVATIGGFVDFRRLRPNITWTLTKRDSFNDDGSEIVNSRWIPLDPNHPSNDSPPLLTEFCSESLPQLRKITTANEIRFDLPEGEIGNTGAITCFLGMIKTDLPMYKAPDNAHGSYTVRCEVPAELLNMDMFFHHSLGLTEPPEVKLRSNVDMYSGSNGNSELPFYDRIQDLGISSIPRPAPEIPRSREMIEYIFSLLAMPLIEFHGYRIRMAHPAYPTSLEMRYPLHDR
ncbi:MAG: hypothetical protein JKX70_05710 [Phycisphaerales bacterium]|nr:hypothetical protein [Phycisphaerales bacterium]